MQCRIAGYTLGAFAALVIMSQDASAQHKPKPKVSKDSAQAIAVAALPNGRVAAGEYEHEKGKWIWSFELKVPGKSGIEEVNVDAMTGQIVSREHEGPKTEAREAKAEKKSKTP